MNFIEFVLRFLTATSFLNLMKYVEQISKTYFSGESLLFVYWSDVSMEFRDALMDYFVKSEIGTIEICNCDYVTDDINWERSFVQNIVVLFGDMVPERRHIESIRQCMAWNPHGKILAVVDKDDVVNETLRKIWTFTKAINVTVMVAATSSVKYYTLYPYENFKVVELDQSGLFPPKPLNDLNGSVLSVATAQIEPYVMKAETRNNYTKGLEIRILKSLSKKFNFQYEFINPPPGENIWLSMADNNRRAVGDLGLLHRCEADLMFHGISVAVERCGIADATSIHTYDSIIWVVPTRPFSFDWRSIILLFKKELWALILATFVLIAVMMYLIVKFEFGGSRTFYNAFDAFFQTFGIHISVPIYFYRKGLLYRLFIFTVSYYAMIIVGLYQSSLITHLTTPGSEAQYDTIEEAMEDGLIGSFFFAATPIMNISDHDLWNQILQPGKHFYEFSAYKILKWVAFNKTVYSYFNRNFANFIIHKNLLDENHEPRVLILPDYFAYPVTFFTSRGHPLKSVIKYEILRLVESGIVAQWMEEILSENLEVNQGEVSSDGDNGPKALSIEHLKGAFYIIPLMCSIAVVVFACEVVYYYWANKNRKIEKKVE